jgi:hypothetical protein
MAMAARPVITDDQLQGFKYFKKFLPLLDRLHGHATERDKAHNRELHYDQYVALQLVFFFNPIVTSMRGLVQASELRKVRKELGVCPTSLGSFSEAGSVFDVELLEPSRVRRTRPPPYPRRPSGGRVRPPLEFGPFVSHSCEPHWRLPYAAGPAARRRTLCPFPGELNCVFKAATASSNVSTEKGQTPEVGEYASPLYTFSSPHGFDAHHHQPQVFPPTPAR